jgi:hypothetical protein
MLFNFIMMHYRLRMFPWTCSTTPKKGSQIYQCAQKLMSDVAFSARFSQKERNLNLTSLSVFSRVFPSPIPLKWKGDTSLSSITLARPLSMEAASSIDLHHTRSPWMAARTYQTGEGVSSLVLSSPVSIPLRATGSLSGTQRVSSD